MMMEQVICDLCGRDDACLFYTLPDTNYGCQGTFRLVQCRGCRLVYQNPRPTAAEIGAYYLAAQYHPFRAVWEGGTAVPAPLHSQRAKMLTTKVGPGRVLDVGCGSGLFLLAMQKQGWQVAGVEPNETAAQFGQTKLQLNVQTGDIFALTPSADFDLITFWDVLEHTHSPKAVLQHAHQLLKPAGFLAINVPNWGSLERRLFRERWIALDAPRHLYHFTPQTLVNLLEVCGFVPEVVKASAPPLSLSSNVLRWLGDNFLRRGQAKALVAERPEHASPTPASPKHQRIIALTHQLMRLPNAAANSVNRGAGLTVIAQKSDL
jgi:2-polyprenyl-3-methyl-5-hydroxy-6-metoxy-1,4-benzoquinol methylase